MTPSPLQKLLEALLAQSRPIPGRGEVAVSQEALDALQEALQPVEEKLSHFDDKRLRNDRDWETDPVAYVEAVWGPTSYAFDAAVRDLEAMRRGLPGEGLRPPQTHYEAVMLVRHVRALANNLARHFGATELVREGDDLGE